MKLPRLRCPLRLLTSSLIVGLPPGQVAPAQAAGPAELLTGSASTSITPAQPIALNATIEP